MTKEQAYLLKRLIQRHVTSVVAIPSYGDPDFWDLVDVSESEEQKMYAYIESLINDYPE